MRIPLIKTKSDLVGVVNEIGFLPFFMNDIPGFSLEDHAASSAWYGGAWTGKINWPAWEWKGEIAADKELVYGKLFQGKAGFVSLEWFPDLCNYRRDGYDFDARYDDGLVAHKDKEIYDYLSRHGSTLSKTIKKDMNYKKGGNKGFETVITRLMMQTYVTVTDFEYQTRKATGEVYGWGVARYDITESFWGEELCRDAYDVLPEISYERIMKQLKKLLPQISEGDIKRLIR